MNSFVKYFVVGLSIRVATIIYGEWHDEHWQVPFTDVDYKVFSDAARYVEEGSSPYRRHTYRYPPVLAWLLVPNSWVHPAWGKLLFSLADICTAALIHFVVKAQGFSESISLKCSAVWLLNPLAIIIAARGNSDSIIGLTVLLSVFFLLKNRPSLTGLFLAMAIHIRLYPIVFSLPIYLSLRSKEHLEELPSGSSKFQRILNYAKRLSRLMYPNRNQFTLIVSCVTFLTALTWFCYFLYGQEFLEESLLYHLKRKDTRHNFSVYFYLLYLRPNQPSGLIFLPQMILLLFFSFTFGKKSSILFCLFAQTFTMVSYNPVLTSQYLIWYLSLLPPNLPCFKLSLRQAAILTSWWLFSQLAWLVPAYLLEFRGRDTFLYIWFQGIGIFCANLAVLVRLIKGYSVKGENFASLKQD